MDVLTLVLVAVLALALGVIAGWLARGSRPVGADPALVTQLEVQHSLALQLATEQVRREESEARAEVLSKLAAAEAQVVAIQEAVESAQAQYRELADQNRRDQAERERAAAGESKVLERLAPVAESLAKMQAKVDDMEKQRTTQHVQLAEQILHTHRAAEQSKTAAEALASALSNNAVRGVWGETQLKTLVESAGLVNRVDFTTQHSIEAESGARRPDMVVNLPGGKQMAVDSKVPYSSFMEASKPGLDPQERARLMTEHAKKVKSHVDALAAKNYWSGLDASPEFTIAYIPNDSLLSAAIDADPGLMEHAFSKGVLLATPLNLWAVLKTVAFTWQQDVLADDAKQLFDLSRTLYERMSTLAQHADKLRRSIETTVKDYNKFAGSLERQILPAARKLNALDEAKVLGAGLGSAQVIEEQTKPFTAPELTAHDKPTPELVIAPKRPELDYALDLEIVAGDASEDLAG